MRLTGFVLLVAVVGTLLLVPSVSAQSAACEEIVETESNASMGPGGELTDLIGDRTDELDRALDDAQFGARLDNATSDRMRARLISERVNRTEERLSALERCWQTHQTALDTGNSTAVLSGTQIESFQSQVRSLHQRINETEKETVRLPASLRETYHIGAETFDTLDGRVTTLRQEVVRPKGRRPVLDS